MNKKENSHRKPTYLDFNIAEYAWKPDIDYQANPEKYRVGKGEQGVLICEPYKSRIGAHWRFKNPEIAEKCATEIYDIFLEYLTSGDFVGADLARKYLQMGYTRARRYANYKGGKKYDSEHDYAPLDRCTGSSEKAVSAAIFYRFWKKAEENSVYHEQKIYWKKKLG